MLRQWLQSTVANLRSILTSLTAPSPPRPGPAAARRPLQDEPAPPAGSATVAPRRAPAANAAQGRALASGRSVNRLTRRPEAHPQAARPTQEKSSLTVDHSIDAQPARTPAAIKSPVELPAPPAATELMPPREATVATPLMGGTENAGAEDTSPENAGTEDTSPEDISPYPSAGDASRRGGAAGDELALAALLESLLFVASEPVSLAQLAGAVTAPEAVVVEQLQQLAKFYLEQQRGLRLQNYNGKYQLVTMPEAAAYIEHFLNLDTTTRLSSAALETLAVVAYRQPVTRSQIEAVRGVDCAGVLRSLLQRGLIQEIGRMEGVGRPILYGVTEHFMQHFGLMDLAELPPLEQTEEDLLWATTALAEAEAAAQPSGVHVERGSRRA
jgi:segregation and condensation protein B